MMLLIAVCDDDEQMLRDLKIAIETYMADHTCLYEIKLFPSAKILLNEWQAFDIVFLDIQMKDLNGVQAARTIRKMDPHCSIVFITVSQEFVFDAFEVSADNYLIKPLCMGKLTQTLDRIVQRLEMNDKRYLTIQKNNAVWKINIDDILYCEVVKRVIYLHSLRGDIDYYETIEHLETLLPSFFFRCHRSYLINLKLVQGYQNSNVTMQNGDVIPVSRLRRAEFLQAMLYYIKGSKADGI